MSKAKEEYLEITTELAAGITKLSTVKGMDEKKTFSLVFEIEERIRFNCGKEAICIARYSLPRRNTAVKVGR